ncbi:MAG: 30S ribosomal protein S3ae [Candidatus Bathyarchaeota archaeon]|nr:30S ribosomal protein S3ae [Candidatus Bathyarchaeota archaeon]
MPKKTRKISDKWRMKDWYTLYGPSYFGGSELGLAPTADPQGLIGRVVEKTLYEITGDFSQQHIKLYFQVTDLKGDKAETIFKGHKYSEDYLRSLVRRGSTRIDGIFDVSTKDGYKLRVSVVAFSISRVKAAQTSAIRAVMKKILVEKAGTLDFDQFIQEVILGKIASDIYNEAKKTLPIRHIGIRKSKLIATPKPLLKKEAS